MVAQGAQLHSGHSLPLTASHEGVGTIAKLGPEVDTTQFSVGDRVGTLNYYHPCGTASPLCACADVGQGSVRTVWTGRRGMFIVRRISRRWGLRVMDVLQSTSLRIHFHVSIFPRGYCLWMLRR